VVRTTYDISEGTVRATYKVTKFTAKSAYSAGKLIYHVGGFTFKVIAAPLSWPLTRHEIETIDGLPPKEAIRQGKVKKSPYVVRGKRYVPMSVEQARNYRETGIASWYGYET
jgi:rare lipoprotein A